MMHRRKQCPRPPENQMLKPKPLTMSFLKMLWVQVMMWGLLVQVYFMAVLIPWYQWPVVLRLRSHIQLILFFPAIVTLDFGTTGCPGPDGRVRRGKIITEYTNRLIYPGAIATTTFDGFYVDNVHVEGIHKITNTSAGTSNRQYTVELRDAKLTKPNGDYIKWKSDRVITQIEGFITADFHDDVFSITGSGQGQVKRGNLLAGWESTITEPLIKRLTCRWIVKGRIRTVRINSTPTGSSVAILDFGNGVCDNLAVITINGVPHQITLP